MGPGGGSGGARTKGLRAEVAGPRSRMDEVATLLVLLQVVGDRKALVAGVAIVLKVGLHTRAIK